MEKRGWACKCSEQSIKRCSYNFGRDSRLMLSHVGFAHVTWKDEASPTLCLSPTSDSQGQAGARLKQHGFQVCPPGHAKHLASWLHPNFHKACRVSSTANFGRPDLRQGSPPAESSSLSLFPSLSFFLSVSVCLSLFEK